MDPTQISNAYAGCAGGSSPDETSSDKCSELPKDMTAREACEQKEAMKKSIYESGADVMATIFTGGIVDIVNAAGASSESDQQALTTIKAKLRETSVLEQMNSCENSVGQTQSNVISFSKFNVECLKTYAANYPNAPPPVARVENVTQTNNASALVECKAKVLMDTLSKMDVSISSAAIQDAINESKNAMAKAESAQYTCSHISTDMSACKYLSQRQCCQNVLNQKQANLLEGGCLLSVMTNITQGNDMEALQQCNMSAESSITTDMAAEIFNKSIQKADNKAVGIDPMGAIIGFLAVLAVMFIAPIMGGAYVSSKLFSMLGAILIIVGVICMGIFLYDLKKAVTVSDKPFTKCEGTVTAVKHGAEGETTTYGRALHNTTKSKDKKFDDVIGFDFFLSDIKEDPDKIESDTKGTAIYLASADTTSECPVLDTKKMRTVSYLKQRSTLPLLYIAILLIIAGTIQLIISIYKNPKNPTTPKPVQDTTKAVTG